MTPRLHAILILLIAAILSACHARPGAELTRRGDEIMICGRLFHTGAPVVLWTDPGGYDAYRVEKRFVPWDKAQWAAPEKGKEGVGTPNRYGVRFASKSGAAEPPLNAPLTPDQFEQVRAGGWDLDLLRDHVDQFVLHYDVCGVSRQCFRVLHDMRGLSVQFMLDIDGTIYQTMDAKERAWHASSANDRSIGVEIAHIGAYPEGPSPLDQWYQPLIPAPPAPSYPGGPIGGNPSTRLVLPDRLAGGGVRTPNFVGYAARPEAIVGEVQGKRLRQYDFTPQQYDSLARLTAALHAALPRIELDYPRDAEGRLITRQLDPESLANFRGVIGHYHIQDNKIDPGPALQWDTVINTARRHLGLPRLPPGDWINDSRVPPPSPAVRLMP